ncbi:MAG: LysR substrate-binding domain-containing protein [Paracoccaceae bacterium]
MGPGSGILRHIPLQSLRHLEAVVRNGTFEAAAQELNVTPGAVSQQIKRLEEGLGIALFTRAGNRSVPNAKALEIAKSLTDAFGQIEAVLDAQTDRSRSSSVKVKVYQTWANRWLIPRLDRFSQQFPDISVEFFTGYGAVDLNREGIHLALSLGGSEDDSAMAAPLLTPHLAPVCTPAVAAGISGARDLLNMPRIASRNRMQDWARWISATDLVPDESRPLMVFSNSTLVYEATLAGNGIAIAQVELVLADLKSGRLVRPLPQVVAAEAALCLIEVGGAMRRPAPRHFRDWIVSEAEGLRQRTTEYLAGAVSAGP